MPHEMDAKFWAENNDPQSYAFQEKSDYYQYLFKLLETGHTPVGSVVFDIGGGTQPMSRFLLAPDGAPNSRRIFTIDFLKPVDPRFHHIAADINTVLKPHSAAYRRKFVQISRALGVDPASAPQEQVDAFIFSDILNYVPYKSVLEGFLPFLKKGGLLIIYNQPGRTFDFVKQDLPKEGLHSNAELYEFLRASSYGLRPLFLKEAENAPGVIGEKNMCLVAQKR